VPNEDIKKADYNELKNIPRPGHADWTYLNKYGIKS
jgi:chorismate synthase